MKRETWVFLFFVFWAIMAMAGMFGLMWVMLKTHQGVNIFLCPLCQPWTTIVMILFAINIACWIIFLLARTTKLVGRWLDDRD